MRNDLSKMIVANIVGLSRINYVYSFSNLRKNRSQCALAFKYSGRTIYRAEGRKYLSDATHIVFLPKGLTYSFDVEEVGACITVEFELDDKCPAMQIESYQLSSQAGIYNLPDRLERLWTFRKPGYRNKCMSGLYALLAKIEEQTNGFYQLTSKYKLIEPSVHYLESHYQDDNITCGKLAALSGISEVYFRKIFKGIYKVPPAKYIQAIRIQKAKDFLIGDYNSIGEIAEAVGYGNIQQFCKIFKKVTGLTPTQFAQAKNR
jgi:YesN/AraC family two-component response regulator